jgi:site-specific DNA-methyltransferase (adenine-specific)
MTPYYQENGITIYHGDSREVLPLLPKVDLVLTDPPFSVRGDSWDSFSDPFEFECFTARWLSQSYQVAGLVACFFPDKFLPMLMSIAQRWNIPYRRGLVWRKPAGSQFGGASMDGFWFDFEMVFVFGEPSQLKHADTRFSVLEWRTITNQTHGCEKPEGLLKQIIERYTALGATVVDPFMGTGTTLRAAKGLGRCAVGIDSSERNCEEAADRLRQEVLQFA